MKHFLPLILFVCLFYKGISQSQNTSNQSYIPRFIKFEPGTKKIQSQLLLKNTLKLSINDEMRYMNSEKDNLGFSHEKFQQFYKGIPVEGYYYKLHSKNEEILNMTGMFAPIVDLGIKPNISESLAFINAKGKINATKYAWDAEMKEAYPNYAIPKGELVIYADPKGIIEPQLAYKFDIFAIKPYYRSDVFVNAHSGQIIAEHTKIHHANTPATVETIYNGTKPITADFTGTNYRLRQNNAGVIIESKSLNNGTSAINSTEVTSNTPNFTADPVANQAYWSAEKTYQYYLNKHNRNSYNNLGSLIRTYVHFDVNHNNAGWDGSGINCGDGDGVLFGPFVSVDVIGHEVTHGVTQSSANLIYSEESGALNESFSDIFGESIENHATGTNDWLIAAQLSLTGGALRSMQNPNQFFQPDTYKGNMWFVNDCTTPGNFCGVHVNSGVQNKWFYILSQGENGTNDLGNIYSVLGIGLEKAAQIAYRNLTVYLFPGATFLDAKAGAVQAARDLYGVGSPEEIATINAWYAVGVGGPDCNNCKLYCNSGSLNSQSEWIRNVTIGTFNNVSTASNYSDFTDKTITLAPGSTNNVTLNQGFAFDIFSQNWAIWIDYNNDGDFTDVGEKVISNIGVSSFGTLVVPLDATGTTRMRVSMKNGGVPLPCEKFNFGETEDYTIHFGTPDSVPPTAPIARVSNISMTTARLDWAPSTDNIGVLAYNIIVNGAKIASTNNLFFDLTNLAQETFYNVSIEAVDDAGNKTPSNLLAFSTKGQEMELLAAYFENGWDGWQDGGDNCTRVKSNKSYEGSYSIMLKNNSEEESAMVSPLVNLTAFNSATLDFYFEASNFQKEDQLIIYYQNGRRWQKLAKFEKGREFSSGGFFHAYVNIQAPGLPANTRFMIQADAHGSNNKAYIDQVTLTGRNEVNLVPGVVKSIEPIIKANLMAIKSFNEDEIANPAFYPNPAFDFIKIGSMAQVKSIKILSPLGKEVWFQNKFIENTLDISRLIPGLYFVIIETPNGLNTQKLIKQ